MMDGEILPLLWGIHPMDTRRPLSESLSGLAPRRPGIKHPDGWTKIQAVLPGVYETNHCSAGDKPSGRSRNANRPPHGRQRQKNIIRRACANPGGFMSMNSFTRAQLLLAAGLWLLAGSHCLAQIGPEHRNLLELGHDKSFADRELQWVYAYYYCYNRPDFFCTNMVLRLAIAPVYMDGELGLIPHPATNSGFLDKINLSLNSPVEIPATDLNDTSLNFQRDLPSESFDELQPRPGDAPKPALTVADRKLNYELLDSKSFALKLNLTPVYLNPEAIIPKSLTPGLDISIKF
jgi:hypothetical protein